MRPLLRLIRLNVAHVQVWKTDAGSSGPSAEVVAEAEGELKEILSRSHNYSGQYDALEAKL